MSTDIATLADKDYENATTGVQRLSGRDNGSLRRRNISTIAVRRRASVHAYGKPSGPLQVLAKLLDSPRPERIDRQRSAPSSRRRESEDISIETLDKALSARFPSVASMNDDDMVRLFDRAEMPPMVSAVARTYPAFATAMMNVKEMADSNESDLSSRELRPQDKQRTLVDRKIHRKAVPPKRTDSPVMRGVDLWGDPTDNPYEPSVLNGVENEAPNTDQVLHHQAKAWQICARCIQWRSSEDFDHGRDYRLSFYCRECRAQAQQNQNDPVASRPSGTHWLGPEEGSDLAIEPATTLPTTFTQPLEHRACISCTEELPLASFPSVRMTSACDHETEACRDCVQLWISSQLADNQWNRISCMQCRQRLQYDDVIRHADQKTSERFDMLSMRAALGENAGFRWCTASGCESGQIHDDGAKAPIFQCVACGDRYCVVHQEAWHEGETCAQFDRRMGGDDSTSYMENQGGAEDQVASDEALARALEHGRDPRPSASHSRHSARRAGDQLADAAFAVALALGMERELNNEQDLTTEAHRQSMARQQDVRAAQVRRDEELAREMQSQWEQSAATEATARTRNLNIRAEQRASEKRRRDDETVRDMEAAHLMQSNLDNEAHEERSRRKEQAKQEAERRKAAKARDDAASAQARDRRRRREEEKASEAAVKTVSKQCRCGWNIQKTAGCDHMTCRKCSYEFCWECLASYDAIRSRGNTAHQRSCKHYA